LAFWYERPELNERAMDGGDEYFMRFAGKADYAGPFDNRAVPQLDYQGNIGIQYNPIAIAQYGLGRFNRWRSDGEAADRAAWMAVGRWLVQELKPNRHGVPMWHHHFDWPYRETLEAPWYSGLAQGTGLSMLVRAAQHGSEPSFAVAAHKAFECMRLDVGEGGVIATDRDGSVWIEEYIVNPPSHILNGYIWALWGVHDYAKWSSDPEAWALWHRCIETLQARISDYDTGWWSLYELPIDGAERMLASRYYHSLHITQFHVLHRLTGIRTFQEYATRFQKYLDNWKNVARAFAEKSVFKLRNY
jgi:hypothetical protein